MQVAFHFISKNFHWCCFCVCSYEVVIPLFDISPNRFKICPIPEINFAPNRFLSICLYFHLSVNNDIVVTNTRDSFAKIDKSWTVGKCNVERVVYASWEINYLL